MKNKISNCSSYGKLMLLIGLLVMIPLLILPFYPEDTPYALSFAIPAFASMLLGFIICLRGKGDSDGNERQASLRRSSLVVLFAWTWGILVGVLLHLFSAVILPPYRLCLKRSAAGLLPVFPLWM